MRAPTGPVSVRIAVFGLGLLIKKGVDHIFDFGVYPVALISFGYLWGGVAMTCLSVAMNLLMIRGYDWLERDFLLIESIKQLKERRTGSVLGRCAGALLRLGDVPAFVVLSWIEDPVVVTLYLRRGSHLYNGFARRDWLIFAGSTILGNALWIASLASTIELFQLLQSWWA